MTSPDTIYRRAVADWLYQLPLVSATETKVLPWPRTRFTDHQLSLVPKMAAARGWRWILLSAKQCHFEYVPDKVAPRTLRRWLKTPEALRQLDEARTAARRGEIGA